MKNIKIIAFQILILVFFYLSLTGKIYADTLTYPDIAPCDTTLQACITGATSGDTIEIATNTRISESLTINKSVILIAQDGFEPTLGSIDSRNPTSISIDDAGALGGSVAISLENLNLDAAQINVSFDEATGHSFELINSNLSHMRDSDNETGIDLTLSVPSTILIQENSLSTTGQSIELSTNLTSGTITVDILGNKITTTEPDNSHEGIQIRPSGPAAGTGEVIVDILSNVIYGVGGCNCGANSGIDIEPAGSITSTVNIINNTIDDMQTSAYGLYIDTPSGTSRMTVNLFNNIISNALGGAFYMPAADPDLTINNDFNDFFNNTSVDFGGYTAGSTTLNVDPLYQDSSNANYRLSSESSLIEAGTNSPTGGLPSLDADGNDRLTGDTVDIGALEAVTDLELSGTALPAEVTAGDSLVYTLTVENNGPDETTEIILTSALATNTTLTSSSASQGSCTESSGTITCDLEDLENGNQITVTLILEIDIAETSTLETLFELTGNLPDSNTLNNSLTLTSSVIAPVVVNPVDNSDGEDDDGIEDGITVEDEVTVDDGAVNDDSAGGDSVDTDTGDTDDDTTDVDDEGDVDSPTDTAVDGGGCSLNPTNQDSSSIAFISLVGFLLVIILLIRKHNKDSELP